MHGVQAPSDELLEERCRDSDPVVLQSASKETEAVKHTKSQFFRQQVAKSGGRTVAVDIDTPFALAALGKISGGYSQGIGPQELRKASDTA